MNLADLPEEILLIIIRQLDTKCVHNVYKTCRRLGNVIAMHGVMRVCNLSVSTLSTAKSLQLEMVKLISNHLYELNMSGVPDLTMTLLLPALKKMKCLQTLNVGYTKINQSDLIDIFKYCPTIKNITINIDCQITKTLLDECPELFKNLENVHLILESWYSYLPLHFLDIPSINTLKYTMCNWQGPVYKYSGINYKAIIIDSMLTCNHFCMFLLSWENEDKSEGTWNLILPDENLVLLEFIVIEYDKCISLCVSPMFKQFFIENFYITTFLDLHRPRVLKGNIAIFTWDKMTTIFDELFFLNLKRRIKAIFPCEMKVINEEPLSLATHACDWFHFNVVPANYINRRAEDMMNGLINKKRRMVDTFEFSNYDSTFKELKDVELSMFFTDMYFVTISANSEYLRKLTYLSLIGETVLYSNDFFNILFKCCDKLVTLNVEAPTDSPCCSAIMNSISLSHSLKNIRLTDRKIDFNMLFLSFSQCTTLENIRIIENSYIFCEDLGDTTNLFKKCNNLYCLYIRVPMDERSAMENLQILNKSKTNCSNHGLNLTLHNSCHGVKCEYDPYMDVFNLKPIKAV